MFEDKVDREELDKMPSEYKELLERVLTIQADCEIGGPHLYVKDILPSAPSKVNQLIVARTAAEEMDHYRKVARLAGEIGKDTSFLLSIPNQKRYLEAFRGVITTWEDFSVFGFLIDRVGRYQLEEFLDCSYLPLQRILPEVLKEEVGHIGFGTNQTAELAAKNDESPRARAAECEFLVRQSLGYVRPFGLGTLEPLLSLGIEAAQQQPSALGVQEGSGSDHPKHGTDCSRSRARQKIPLDIPLKAWIAQ